MPDQKYRLTTHHKGDSGFHEQGSVVTEEQIGSSALQSLLEAGSAEAYDPHTKAAVDLPAEAAQKIRDSAIDELKAAGAEKDNEIRKLRAKLNQITEKAPKEADRRRERAKA